MKSGKMMIMMLMIGLTACGTLKKSEPAVHEFAAEYYTDGGDTLPYRFLQPVKIQKGRTYPLVIFLHGAGERGNDNERQLIWGGWIFKTPEHAADYPCFVLAPQCPEEKRWVEVDWDSDIHTMPAEPSRPMEMVKDLTGRIIGNYPVDIDRIYVTGLSMGGFGTWDMVSRWPEMFAAAAPVCGGGDLSMAPRVKDIPVWVFHGEEDPVVSVERSRTMVKAVREAGGTNIRYTEYPGVGHGSWKPAFREPEFLPWMFAQKKK